MSALANVIAAVIVALLGAVALSAPAPVYRGPPPAKVETRIEWPEGLKVTNFDDARYHFSKSFAKAKAGGAPDSSTVKELRSAWKQLSEKFGEHADEMSPAQYIESRRFLDRMNKTVKALSDPPVRRGVP